MKILVTGGRKYHNAKVVGRELEKLKLSPYDDMVIQGGATGADTLAAEWCANARIPCLTVYADWSVGHSAGVIRNTRMLEHGPNLVLAFPGGKGTGDMVTKAQKAGIPVQFVKE